MDSSRIKEIIAALNKKNVSQPCPRCSSKNFSVVGESEISVTQPPSFSPHDELSLRNLGRSLSSLPVKTTMSTVIITCDNCGYIAQHAQAALGLPLSSSTLSSLARFAK